MLKILKNKLSKFLKDDHGLVLRVKDLKIKKKTK